MCFRIQNLGLREGIQLKNPRVHKIIAISLIFISMAALHEMEYRHSYFKLTKFQAEVIFANLRFSLGCLMFRIYYIKTS